MTTLMRYTLLAAVIFSCVGCDQTTKLIASRELKGRPAAKFLGNTIQLTYAENAGAFLSLGAELPPRVRGALFVILSSATVLSVLGFAVAMKSLGPTRVLCLGLVAAGGLGNLIDRIWLGAARDFIFLRIGPFHTGVFNVADVAITLGALALFSTSLLKRSSPATTPPGAPAGA